MQLITQREIQTEKDYREEAESPATEVSKAPAASSLDVISQMRANLSQLEDLHGRLSYVMGEVRHIIKKSAPRS